MKGNSLIGKNKDKISLMHKRLDAFIQASLDKYNFVEPWNDLYDVTGHYAYYIISNQSTIPDLVIFNKGFDKNECFVESQTQELNKFPRKHFILHLKAQKDKEKFQPLSHREKLSEDKTRLEEKKIKPLQSTFQHQKKFNFRPQMQAQLPQPKKQLQLQPHHQPFNQQKGKQKVIESDDEEDPEWGDDDVKEFKKTKVDFKEIPLQKKINMPKEANVISGDELFQVDPEVLFGSIPQPQSIEQTNLIKKQSKKDTQPKESQLKKEDEFFKDLCNNNEKQNDVNPLIDLNDQSINNTIQNNNNIWSNQRNVDYNQKNINSNHNMNYSQNMNQLYAQMMINNNSNQSLPNHQMQYQLINNRMRNPTAFPIQSMAMWPRYNNHHININMMRPNMQIIPNSQSQLNPFNYFNPISNLMQVGEEGYNINYNNTITNDDGDDLMSDFNTKYNLYNPSVFLENPGLIVKKNMFEANWFLMKDNKIIGNYNSEELFFFLSEKINENKILENVSISDYHTDVFFKPTNLLEILKEFVPKIKKNLELKQMSLNHSYNQQEQSYHQISKISNNTGNNVIMSKMNINNNQQNNYYN